MKEHNSQTEAFKIADEKFYQLLKDKPDSFNLSDRTLFMYAFLDGYIEGSREALNRMNQNDLITE